MNINRNKWIYEIIVSAVVTTLPGALYARDPGTNLPGAIGNTGRAGRGVRR